MPSCDRLLLASTISNAPASESKEAMPHSYTSSSGSRHGTVTSLNFNQYDTCALPSIVSPVSATGAGTHNQRAYLESNDSIQSPILLADLKSQSLQRPASRISNSATRFTRQNSSSHRESALQTTSQSQQQNYKTTITSNTSASRFARVSPSVESQDSSPTPANIVDNTSATSRFSRRASMTQSRDSTTTSTHASRFRASRQATVESCASDSSVVNTPVQPKGKPSAEFRFPPSPRISDPGSGRYQLDSIVDNLDNNENITYEHPPIEKFSPPLSNCSDYSIFSQLPEAKSTPARVHRFRSQPKGTSAELYPLAQRKDTLAAGTMGFNSAERASDTIASRRFRALDKIEVSQDEEDIYERLQVLQARNYELEAQARSITDIFKTKLAESRADVALKARIIEEKTRVIEDQTLKIGEQNDMLTQKTRTIEAKDAQIREMNSRLQDLHQICQTQHDVAAAKAAHVKKLQDLVMEIQAEQREQLAQGLKDTESKISESNRQRPNLSRSSLQAPPRTGQNALSRNVPADAVQSIESDESRPGQPPTRPSPPRTTTHRPSPPPTYEEDVTVRPVQSPAANCQHLIDAFTAQLNIKKEYFEVSSRAYLSHNAGSRRAARQHLKERIDETGKEIETLSEYIYTLQDILHAGV